MDCASLHTAEKANAPDPARIFAIAVILIPWAWFAFMVLHAWQDQPPPDPEFGKKQKSIPAVANLLFSWQYACALVAPALTGIALYLKPRSKFLRFLTVVCLICVLKVFSLSFAVFMLFGGFVGWGPAV